MSVRYTIMHPRSSSQLFSRLLLVLRAGAQRRCLQGSSSTRPYVPRRAMLYVPGNDERKVKKVSTLNVDSAVLDCEDGVALNRKEEARHTVARLLSEVDFGQTEVAVRVNSVSSGLAAADLEIVAAAPTLPAALMLPKVESPAELDWFAEKLQSALCGRSLQRKLRLVSFVESAIGMLNFRDTCQRAAELEEDAPFLHDGVVFGSDDFCADIGATRTEDATELLYARQHVIVVTKAFGLQTIDLVHINFKDLEGLRRQSEEGARMGFTGKQVIHPSQIEVVQAAFTPTAERMEWATQLIAAFNEHQDSGKGAFTFRGHMIDMPLLLQAKNIVQMAEAVKDSAKK